MMTLSAPATLLTAFATLLAVLIALGSALLVARTRTRVKIFPPVMSGSPELECALRVQANTVEQIVIFLPALWLAALYFQGWTPPIIGLLWSLGRVLYALGYRPTKPGAREPGFIIGMLSTVALIVLAGIGIAQAWMAAG